MRRTRQPRPRLWPWFLIGVSVLVLAGCVGYELHRPTTRPATVAHSASSSAHPQSAKATPKHLSLAKALPANKFTGVAAVYQGGKRVAVLTRGAADRKQQLPNTLDTMFEIDSVQKSLTAGLVMQAINKHQLAMTDRLSAFYPQVKGGEAVTIRELLDMTAGLEYTGNFIEKTYVDDATRVASLAKRTHVSSKWLHHGRYQAANYILLCGILMKVTRQSYEQLFTNTYITGLHLHHTRFAYDPNTSGEATGYGWDKQHGLAKAQPYTTAATTSHQELGTGQVYMSIDDLYHLQASLLQGKVITPAGALWLYAPGSNKTYGGGLYATQKFRLSNGYGYGFQCFMRITTDGLGAVVVMANCSTPNHFIENAANKLAGDWLE